MVGKPLLKTSILWLWVIEGESHQTWVMKKQRLGTADVIYDQQWWGKNIAHITVRQK